MRFKWIKRLLFIICKTYFMLFLFHLAFCSLLAEEVILVLSGFCLTIMFYLYFIYICLLFSKFYKVYEAVSRNVLYSFYNSNPFFMIFLHQLGTNMQISSVILILCCFHTLLRKCDTFNWRSFNIFIYP